MKKKLTSKNPESIIFISLNENLKNVIHKNMATVHNINIQIIDTMKYSKKKERK